MRCAFAGSRLADDQRVLPLGDELESVQFEQAARAVLMAQNLNGSVADHKVKVNAWIRPLEMLE